MYAVAPDASRSSHVTLTSTSVAYYGNGDVSGIKASSVSLVVDSYLKVYVGIAGPTGKAIVLNVRLLPLLPPPIHNVTVVLVRASVIISILRRCCPLTRVFPYCPHLNFLQNTDPVAISHSNCQVPSNRDHTECPAVGDTGGFSDGAVRDFTLAWGGPGGGHLFAAFSDLAHGGGASVFRFG